jgi:LuxR family transcriptional regulator, maltose regulon positive regulatory protein
VPDFLRDPAMPAPLDLTAVAPSLLAEAPDRLLALAAELLLSGDTARGGEYLDLLERARPAIPADSRLAARLAAFRSFHYAQIGRLDDAVTAALAARAVQDRTQLDDDWNPAAALILLRVYANLEDLEAVEREATAALTLPGVAEPARLVMIPGAQALARFEAGYLAEAAKAAEAAEAQARRLRFDEHFFAVDHLRTLAGLALERRDLDTAERLTEHVLSITERRRPLFEFLTLLDRAGIWAAHGQVRDALATVGAARLVLAAAGSALLARADELEALIRLSLGDLRTPADLAAKLPAARRGLLLAKVALASGDFGAAQDHLQAPALADLTPRRALVRRLLLAGAAIGRGDPMADGILGNALHAARTEGFLNTVVTTAPQVTSHLIERAARLRPDPFVDQLIAAAVQVRAAQPGASRSARPLAEPLTDAELRILKLLPTSTYLQMAATCYISRNTVKTHVRSIYNKLGVTSRSQAVEQAIDLGLL